MFYQINKYLVNVILIISMLSLISLRNLRFNSDFKSLMPASGKDAEFFQEFQNKFHAGADEEMIFIGLENTAGIFDQNFLRKTDELTLYIFRLENIRKAYSLTNANIIFFKDSQINARPLIHIQNPQLFKQDSIYLFNSPEYRRLLVSQNGKSIAVVAFNEENLNSKQKVVLVNSIEKKLDSLGFDGFHLISKIGVEQTLVKTAKKQLAIFAVVSLLVVGLFFLLLYKTVKPMIFIFLTFTTSCLWTGAIMQLSGYSFEPLSLFLIIELGLVSILNFFHLFYFNTVRNKNDFSDIGKKPDKFFLLQAVLVILSLSLLYTNIPAIKNLSSFSAIGLVVNSILSFILFPFSIKGPDNKKGDLINKSFSGLFNLVKKHSVVFVIGFLSFLIILLVFSFQFMFKGKVSDQLAINATIQNNYKFMEENFYGTRPFEMVLTARDKNFSFFRAELMEQVAEIENYLIDSCKVGGLISPLSLFKGANKAFNAGETSFYKLPGQENVSRLYEAILQTDHSDEMQRYLSDTGYSLRISGRMPDLSKEDFEKMVKKFKTNFNSKGLENYVSYHFTGYALMSDKTIEDIRRTFPVLLISAFSVVFILFFYFVRSICAVLLSLVFTGFPLLMMMASASVLNLNIAFEGLPVFLIALIVLISLLYFHPALFFVRLSGNAINDTVLIIRNGKIIFLEIIFLLFLSISPLIASAFKMLSNFGLLLSAALLGLAIAFFFIRALGSFFQTSNLFKK